MEQETAAEAAGKAEAGALNFKTHNDGERGKRRQWSPCPAASANMLAFETLCGLKVQLYSEDTQARDPTDEFKAESSNSS